jgi:hypothetical protein
MEISSLIVDVEELRVVAVVVVALRVECEEEGAAVISPLRIVLSACRHGPDTLDVDPGTTPCLDDK